MSSYLRDTTLVNGSSDNANTFLSSASTSSFVATLDGLDNTVEISPDGTRWISIPIVETDANSSTFVGTIGFDFTAIRLTTDTSLFVTSVKSDFTGTSTLIFTNAGLPSTSGGGLQTFIGTGAVIRISDGTTQEFAEVTSPGDTTLSVTKLSGSTALDPDKTWIQVIGNDMMTQMLDTTSDGTELFRIGGYFGATYRIRYNDAVGASNAYLGGDTRAATTSNMGFTTYTGTLSTDVTGSSGPNAFVVVTLVDEDLNTSTSAQQSTFEVNSTTSGTGIIILRNENGLGLPSGSSTGNVSRGFKNGGTAKILYASTLSNILSPTADQSSNGNTIDFQLVETGVNSGTFKGSFQLSISTLTTNTNMDSDSSHGGILKVSNGDAVSVFYNDSPSATAEDNSSIYTVTSSILIVTGLGSLSLSKETAYLSGDTVVATVVDFDKGSYILGDFAVITLTDAERNTNTTTAQTLLSDVFIQTSPGNSTTVRMVESGADTGTFLGSIKVASDGGTTEFSQIQASVGDTLKITYVDAINTTGSSRIVTDTASVVEASTPAPTTTPTAIATAMPGTSPTPPATLPSPTPPATLPPTLPPITPLVTPTPAVCEPEAVTAFPSTITLKRKKSKDVTVTVTSEDGCPVAGEMVKRKVNSAGTKFVKGSPESETTDIDGQVVFTIIAKNKTGKAAVKFKVKGVITQAKVKVLVVK